MHIYRAAVDALQQPTILELDQVFANRHQADVESLGKVLDPHTAFELEQLNNLAAPFLSHMAPPHEGKTILIETGVADGALSFPAPMSSGVDGQRRFRSVQYTRSRS